MDKHGEFMTFDRDAMVVTCSECKGVFRLGEWPMKVNINKNYDHTFEFGLEVLGITVDTHDPGLRAFEEFLNE